MYNSSSRKKKEKRKNFLWVLLLLFCSGNPIVFEQSIELLRLALSIGLFIYSLVDKKTKYTTHDTSLFFLIVFSIFLLQIASLSNFSYPAAINIVSKWFLGIFIVRKLGYEFRVTYLKVMYFLSLFSFLGLIIYKIGFYPGILVNENKYLSIILHNCHANMNSLRNSGMFWEPGAFQGYLTLTFMLFIDSIDQLWKTYRKQTIVIIAALISTFSTTGYIAFALIIIYYIVFKFRNKIAKILLVPIIVSGIFYLYNNLDFLGTKINKQIEQIETYEITVDRLGSAILDWHYIKKHPIIGNGLMNDTRYEDHLMYRSLISGFSNGFTDIIAKFGIIYILFYFLTIYKNLPFDKKDRLFFCFMIAILLQGEYFLDYPLFAALPFMLINKKDILIKYKS